jgi:hypothetical protein
MAFSRTMFHGRIRPFSDEFRVAMRELADAVGDWVEWQGPIVQKVMESKHYATAGIAGRVLSTWAVINATQSSGTITTGVAPTDLGDGIFEYKAVPVKITGYSAGVFSYAVDDDPRFAPAAYGGGSNITLLNAPTHANDADWKYAGVNTSGASGYPAGFEVRGIGENRDSGGGSSTWKSLLVPILKYRIDAETVLWLLAAEPDHDGACEEGGGGGGGTDLGLSTAIANGSF